MLGKFPFLFPFPCTGCFFLRFSAFFCFCFWPALADTLDLHPCASSFTTLMFATAAPPTSPLLQQGGGHNCKTPEDHQAHADRFAADEKYPLPRYVFDEDSRGPEGIQAQLDLQGWAHPGRQLVVLHCRRCGKCVMNFYAANTTLALRYKDRLCSHQFNINRGHKDKWNQHGGIGLTAGRKPRANHCVSQTHAMREISGLTAAVRHTCVLADLFWRACLLVLGTAADFCANTVGGRRSSHASHPGQCSKAALCNRLGGQDSARGLQPFGRVTRVV